jgi:hypothetical protein
MADIQARLEAMRQWLATDRRCPWPGPKRYEVLRSVVLYGQSPAERALETGVLAARFRLWRGRHRPGALRCPPILVEGLPADPQLACKLGFAHATCQPLTKRGNVLLRQGPAQRRKKEPGHILRSTLYSFIIPSWGTAPQCCQLTLWRRGEGRATLCGTSPCV